MIDSTGAVLPGVLVTCKNVRTGLTVEATSNEVGIFRCPELPIGQYQVTGVLDGFQKIVRSDLIAGHRPGAGHQVHDGSPAGWKRRSR